MADCLACFACRKCSESHRRTQREAGLEVVVPGAFLLVDEPTVIWVEATTFLGSVMLCLLHQVLVQSDRVGQKRWLCLHVLLGLIVLTQLFSRAFTFAV